MSQDLETRLRNLWIKIKKITCITGVPVTAQYITVFIIGFVFAPWSMSLFWVLGFLILWEIFIACTTEMKSPHWNLADRVGLVATYIVAWYLGRIFIGDKNPLN